MLNPDSIARIEATGYDSPLHPAPRRTVSRVTDNFKCAGCGGTITDTFFDPTLWIEGEGGCFCASCFKRKKGT